MGTCAPPKQIRDSNEYNFPEEDEKPKRLKQLNRNRSRQPKKRPPSRRPRDSNENEDGFQPQFSSTPIQSRNTSRNRQEQSTRRVDRYEGNQQVSANEAIPYMEMILLFRNQIVTVVQIILNIFI